MSFDRRWGSRTPLRVDEFFYPAASQSPLSDGVASVFKQPVSSGVFELCESSSVMTSASASNSGSNSRGSAQQHSRLQVEVGGLDLI